MSTSSFQMKSVPLTKSQFAPYDLYDNLTLETFVRGLATQKAQVRTELHWTGIQSCFAGNGRRHVCGTDRASVPAG